MHTKMTPPNISALPPSQLPNFLPSRWPARQQTNVTQAMKEAAAAMFTSSAAKLTPTASASMLVAKACTTISL